ncbi:MAG TPA: hypothetical protein VL123_05890 [Candidatus Udaeobacter sp.]|jgi:ABC-type lipoprotein release transport system permease subunit|nr:hypothetical protein [Candidatus Udaeobacter sp.]
MSSRPDLSSLRIPRDESGMLAGLVFAALLGLVGCFLPALRASRQPLARALRAL